MSVDLGPALVNASMRPTAVILAALLAGCLPTAADDVPVNPSFPVKLAAARQVLRYDADHGHRLRRPVLVVGGFLDPGYAAPRVRDRLRRVTGDDHVSAVSLGFELSFDDCRQTIVAAADAAFPTADPRQTTEVDVVGISMGGLAARYAALSDPTHARRRLRLARLFTISSPLDGARMAELLPFDVHPLQSGMRRSSPLYTLIDRWPQSPDELYAVYSYVRLRDRTVGPENAAVPGQRPWWVSTPAGQSPHDAAFTDPRILADIACRLRGEPPLAHDPPTPLPVDP